MNNSL